MAIGATVLAGDDDTKIGDFEFQHVPRAGEEVIVPWADDAGGIRIFTVGEVIHVAAGSPETVYGGGAQTILRYCIEIE